MSAIFWSQIKDLTRRVEALEAASVARAAPPEPPKRVVEDVGAIVPAESKRGPGRPKKQ